jgi:hypothetical protein
MFFKKRFALGNVYSFFRRDLLQKSMIPESFCFLLRIWILTAGISSSTASKNWNFTRGHFWPVPVGLDSQKGRQPSRLWENFPLFSHSIYRM